VLKREKTFSCRYYRKIGEALPHRAKRKRGGEKGGMKGTVGLPRKSGMQEENSRGKKSRKRITGGGFLGEKRVALRVGKGA